MHYTSLKNDRKLFEARASRSIGKLKYVRGPTMVAKNSMSTISISIIK